MKTLTSDIFTQEVIQIIKEAIENNEGQEVSFVGYIDRNGMVSEAEVMAYGNDSAAPVDMMETLKGDVLIHNHPGAEENEELLRASEADIGLASQLANRKIGFYIIDNTCRFANIIFRPEARIYLKPEEIANIFEDGGLLSKNIPQFEPRAEQVELVNGVTESVNGSKVLISEAGTGTGKSLAYLIPAAVWAVQNKKRVVVSTQTINLQQQIFSKDMQIVERVLKDYVKEEAAYSVLIGKGNYLCKKKLQELYRDQERQESLFEDDEDRRIIHQLEEWSGRCQEGTIGEFGEFIRSDLWEELACDTNSCSRRKCAYYSDCFYYRARLLAERSNILIVNHSLVFSTIDEKSHKSSLPYFSGIVFDEAHHLEDVALKSLSEEFSIQSLLYQFRKLLSVKKEKQFGLLVLLERKGGVRMHPELQEKYNALVKLIRETAKELAEFIFSSADLLKEYLKEGNHIGIDEKFAESEEFSILHDTLDIIFRNIARFISAYEAFADRVRETASNKEVVDILALIGYRIQALTEARGVFDLIFNTANEISFVKWLELTKKNIRFYYSPLEVGDFLANSLFSRKDFTVFTSATLMINKKFDYFKASTGLFLATNKERIEIELPSPFNYEKQAEIYILEEHLDHGTVTGEKTELVKELCLISEGGVLVLFTSYIRLNEMFGRLKEVFVNAGLVPMRQGEASREELLGRMSRQSNVVLFATSSFWEGIDIQGDNLRCVIIEKLPFDSPADPIYKAKVQLLESKEINPFASYSIPRAVLRLKQGMGRLIRSKTDKGVIAIMDNRIRTKNYGQIFINSLPPAKLIYGGLKHIVREAETFFVTKFQ